MQLHRRYKNHLLLQEVLRRVVLRLEELLQQGLELLLLELKHQLLQWRE